MLKILKKTFIFFIIFYLSLGFLIILTACIKTEETVAVTGGTNTGDSVQGDSGTFQDSAESGVPLPPDEANGVFVCDDFAYLADYKTGFQVFDVSDKKKPAKVAELSLQGFVMDTFINEETAFIACGYAGLWIADISNLKDIKIISSLPADDKQIYDGYSKRIAFRDDMVFLADSSGGLKIIDVKNTAKPQLISTFLSPRNGYITDVQVRDDFAFLADDRAGLVIIDISDLKNPRLVSLISTEGLTAGLALQANDRKVGSADKVNSSNSPYLFLADYRNGIRIIDISDTSKPAITGTYDGIKRAVSIGVSGDLLFAADYEAGLVVVDWTNKNKPTLKISYDIGKTNDVFIYNGYVYAAGIKGLSIYKIE